MAVWGGSVWAGPSWATTDGPIGPADPLEVDIVDLYVEVLDVVGLADLAISPIVADLVEIELEIFGPAVAPDPTLLGAIKPDIVDIYLIIPDPLPLTVSPPEPLGGLPVNQPLQLTVEGLTIEGGSVSPAMNSKGSGSFTTKDPVISGSEVTMLVGGVPALMGVVVTSEIAKVTMAEHGEVFNSTVEGHLRELEKALILPDFGSGYGANNAPRDRLGSPKQTTRFMDWTMNGGVTLASYNGGTTIGRNPIEAALAHPALPLPDNWMDEFAEWMWITKPGQGGIGWCNMRCPTASHRGGRVVIEVCMYDSGEVWIDGVNVLSVTQAGVRVTTTIDMTPGNHLVAIRCHNGGGNAGVLFSMLPIVNGKVNARDSNLLRSTSGWVCSQVEHNPAPQTLAQATNRFLAECQSRGFLTNWSFSYGTSNFGEPTTEALTADVGMTMMEWIERCAENYWDYYALGRNLQLIRKGSNLATTGFSSHWVQGVNLESSGTEMSVW